LIRRNILTQNRGIEQLFVLRRRRRLLAALRSARDRRNSRPYRSDYTDGKIRINSAKGPMCETAPRWRFRHSTTAIPIVTLTSLGTQHIVGLGEEAVLAPDQQAPAWRFEMKMPGLRNRVISRSSPAKPRYHSLQLAICSHCVTTKPFSSR
jgi:hypothetical protein